MTRVQVLLQEAEREQFRRQAEREGLSLSGWLRRAGQERLRSRQGRRLSTVRELREFFREVDAREKGREPDWEEHLAVMARSRASGGGGT
ncbi:MAG TPA: antitoxin [Vicinamibacteria bacterium]|nr:antitoxin [Vicinamibacteria bacterium]